MARRRKAGTSHLDMSAPWYSTFTPNFLANYKRFENAKTDNIIINMTIETDFTSGGGRYRGTKLFDLLGVAKPVEEDVRTLRREGLGETNTNT